MSTDLPCIESLESRVLLSGNVTATTIGGILAVLGDEQGNALVLTGQGPGQVLVQSGSSPTTINGGSSSVLMTGVTAVSANLAGGDDNFRFTSAGLTGGVSVFAGEGTNAIFLQSVTAGGPLLVLGGTGNDAVTINTVSAALGVNLNLSEGNNSATVNGLTCGSGMSATFMSGGGDDPFLITGLTAASVFAWTGGGTDTFSLTSSTVNGSVMIGGTGSGAPSQQYADNVTFSSSTVGFTTVLGGLGGDFFSCVNSTINGGLTLLPGSGPAMQSLTGSKVHGSLMTYTGNGGALPFPYVNYSGCVFLSDTTVDNSFNVFCGSGATLVQADAATVGTTALIGGPASVVCMMSNTVVTGTLLALSAANGTSGTFSTVIFAGSVLWMGLSPSQGSLSFNGCTENQGLTALLPGRATAVDLTSSSFQASVFLFVGDCSDNINVKGVTIKGDLNIISGMVDSATINIAPNGAVGNEIDGGLNIMTGPEGDVVNIFGTVVKGFANVSTGDGGDGIAVRASHFYAGVVLSAGSEGFGPSDSDTVALDTGSGKAEQTVFDGPVAVFCGDAFDTVTVGDSGGTHGKAVFNSLAYFDGGSDSNTIYYLGRGNTFNLAPPVCVNFS